MRRDVMEVMAEELVEREAHPLASFTTVEDGRPRLAGMRAGRGRDVDREVDHVVRAQDRKVQVEIRRLMKLRARRKRPEVYRAQSRRYEAANKERRRQKRLAWYWKNRDKMVAYQRAHRKKHQQKRRADSLRRYYADRANRIEYMRGYYPRRYKPEGKRRCSVCRQPGHNVKRCPQRTRREVTPTPATGSLRT
jgi:hypothetical protein